MLDEFTLERKRGRRHEMYAKHRAMLEHVYARDGSLLTPEMAGAAHPLVMFRGGDPRESLWHCFALFSGDAADIRWGNAVLRRTVFSPDYDFMLAALLPLYFRHRMDLESDVLTKTEVCFKAAGPGQMASPGFVGMNDNFASMVVLILVLAGELTGRRELVEDGVRKLQALAGLLERNGANSEYHSPTYTMLTVACCADIANHSSTPAAREKALFCERRIWRDLLARYHPPTGQHGGPSSRSYMNDSCGHLDNLKPMLHQVLGPELVPINYLSCGYTADTPLVVHHDDPAFIAANAAWSVFPDYHPDEADLEALASRTYPRLVTGTAECAAVWEPDQYHEGVRLNPFRTFRYGKVVLSTYQTEDYSLGTASGVPMCGEGAQQDAVSAAWRRRRLCGVGDMRTLFSRLAFDDSVPERNELFRDNGIKTCLQDRNGALVLYRPGLRGLQPFHSLRLCVVLPIHVNRPDAVVVGGRAADGDLESEKLETVFVKDGCCHLALRPLAVANLGAGPRFSFKRHGGFLVFSYLNYQGLERKLNFAQMGMLFVSNGFYVELSSDAESSFAEFQERVNAYQIDDRIDDGKRVVSLKGAGRDMRIEWDPLSMDPPPARIGGVERRVDAFSVGGFAAESGKAAAAAVA